MSQIECKECRQRFDFSGEEQARYEQKGYAAPKRCPECRARRRKEKEPPPPEHEVQCSACGALTRVPFQPTEKRPVYCETCFAYR